MPVTCCEIHLKPLPARTTLAYGKYQCSGKKNFRRNTILDGILLVFVSTIPSKVVPGITDIASSGMRQGKCTSASIIIFAGHDVPLARDAFKPVWVPSRPHSFLEFY